MNIPVMASATRQWGHRLTQAVGIDNRPVGAARHDQPAPVYISPPIPLPAWGLTFLTRQNQCKIVLI